MDANKIFDLFSDKDDKNKDKVESELANFKNSPYYKLGIFKKLIMNGTVFKSNVIKFFSKSDEEFDLKDIDLAGEFIMYNRAWFWISQADISSKDWLEDIGNISDDDFHVAIKLTIHYFEEHEEYEKCAFLKKLQDIVEKYLAD
jgi:hypothetical protein